jgi:excisionase family DNA binding protein
MKAALESNVASKFSLDESTVYKMIDRGEIKAIRIGKKTLRIPSSELERYLEGGPSSELDAAQLDQQVEAFREKSGRDPSSFAEAWRKGKIEDTPENAEVAIEALALRSALASQRVPA